MSTFTSIIRRVANALLGPSTRAASSAVRTAGLATPPTTTAASPGRSGRTATVEVDPRAVGAVSIDYAPAVDGDPDPGEIVWTWVPYEERDGRGKDRPVLIVARSTGGWVLAVQLIAAVGALVYAFIVAFVIGFAIEKTIGFRVKNEDELAGVDSIVHGEEAYAYEIEKV